VAAADGNGTLMAGLLLAGRPVVVVGGGQIAARKIGHLLAAGGRVSVVSPHLHPDLQARLAAGELVWIEAAYAPEQLAGAFLVLAATDDPEVNARVLADGRGAGALVSSVDGQWRQGDLIIPACVRGADAHVAIGTDGRAPRHTAMLRRVLQRHLQALEDCGLVLLQPPTGTGDLARDLRGIMGVAESCAVPFPGEPWLLLLAGTTGPVPGLLRRLTGGNELLLGSGADARLRTWLAEPPRCRVLQQALDAAEGSVYGLRQRIAALMPER